MRTIRAITTVALMLASSAAAFGQTASPEPRVGVTVTAGYQVSSPSFSQSITFEQFSEDGSLTTDYKTGVSPVVDWGVAVRIWKGLGVGVAGSYLRHTSPAQIHALIPHPFVFNQPRAVDGEVDAFHREMAVHIQALYWIQASDRLDLVLSGGPSVIQTDQEFVSDVTYTQSPPYDVATFSGASTNKARETAVGGNVGVEAGWRLTRHLRASALARYSHAKADFTAVGAPEIVVGGLHVGGGVRVVF
jgi:hypothetical protein